MQTRILSLTVVVFATVLLASPRCLGGQPALRVGVAPTLPPMVFKEGKNITGVEPDLARILGRELGREVVFVELPWADLIDSLEANKIDIIMSSMSITRARMTRVAFAEPYLRIGQMALVRAADKLLYSGLGSSFANRTLGVKKGTTSDLLVQQEFPRAKRKYYDSGDEAARALGRKKIDLYIADSTIIWHLAGKHEAEGVVPAPLVFSEEALAWAVRRSDPELLGAVNKAIQNMRQSGEMKQVMKRWIPKLE